MTTPTEAAYMCPVCGTIDGTFAWTDTHGIAQCGTCGAPTRIYFYDENGKRIRDHSPQCCLLDEFITKSRDYFLRTKKIMPSGNSFLGGQELASPEEAREWIAAMDRK